jgi:hypothetical protein
MSDSSGNSNWLWIALVVFVVYKCSQPTYHDPYGNEITKEEHDRRVAQDAAHDALINLIAECKQNPHEGCPLVNQ